MLKEDMQSRVTQDAEHLQRDEDFDNEAHQKNLEALEQEFQTNTSRPMCNAHVSVRPAEMYSCARTLCAWYIRRVKTVHSHGT